jgi:translation initiation factor 1A
MTDKELDKSNEFEDDFDEEEFGEDNEDNEKTVVSRAPLPKKGEVIGIIEQRFGGNKMLVNCLDGKSRNCRVPGRLKRKLWLRPKDVVLVQLWELDKDKGDIILKYRSNQVEWLKRNNYIEIEDSDF